MKIKYTFSIWIVLSLIHCTSFAANRDIAITIDDLPFVGTDSNDSGNLKRSHDRFIRLMQSLIDNHVPATGFVIAGAIGKGQWQLLEEFRKEGFELGNHTYTHIGLNQSSAQKYIDEIARADQKLAPIMTQPKYFRYPYLDEGKGVAKQRVQDFLTENQYITAPVTIDSKDYRFNERLLHIPWRVRHEHLETMKQQYLDYIWKQTVLAEKQAGNKSTSQILLIHANLLNSYFLGDVIQMYKDKGYQFISLGEALNNINSTHNVISTSASIQESGSDIPELEPIKTW